MIPSSVLPVVDLRAGQVVHARAGQRSRYLPLTSNWIERPSQPLHLLNSLQQHLGCQSFYLADLDRIEARGNNDEVILEMLEAGYQLWLDAGSNSIEPVDAWLTRGVHRVIIPTETLSSLEWLANLVQSRLPERLVFSLDLYQGQVRSLPGVLAGMEPMEILERVYDLGLRQFIILDTASVGLSQGCSTLPLCQDLRKRHADAQILTGGGVRHWNEVDGLLNTGIDRVLLATLLYETRPARDTELSNRR